MAKKRTKKRSAPARSYTYAIVIEPDEGGSFHAYCPALPGCHTHGKTIEAARKHIQEAVELYVETLIELDRPVPDGNGILITTTEVQPTVTAQAA